MKTLMLGLLIIFVVGCGVRGDPVPPDTPPLLGRGEPNYSKAAQKMKTPTKKKTTEDEGN